MLPDVLSAGIGTAFLTCCTSPDAGVSCGPGLISSAGSGPVVTDVSSNGLSADAASVLPGVFGLYITGIGFFFP